MSMSTAYRYRDRYSCMLKCSPAPRRQTRAPWARLWRLRHCAAMHHNGMHTTDQADDASLDALCVQKQRYFASTFCCRSASTFAGAPTSGPTFFTTTLFTIFPADLFVLCAATYQF